MAYHFLRFLRHRLIDGIELIGIVLTHGIVLLTASSYERHRTHRHRATHELSTAEIISISGLDGPWFETKSQPSAIDTLNGVFRDTCATCEVATQERIYP